MFSKKTAAQEYAAAHAVKKPLMERLMHCENKLHKKCPAEKAWEKEDKMRREGKWSYQPYRG